MIKLSEFEFNVAFVLNLLSERWIACHSYSDSDYSELGCSLFGRRVLIVGFFSACLASRPGQCGRADGYVLEGKELEFYLKKIKSKKSKWLCYE